MTAFSFQILRLCLRTVQIIGQLDIHRQLLIRRALIVDILAIGIPGHAVTTACVGFITFDIFDILQIAFILYCTGYVTGIFQPCGNSHGFFVTVGIGIDIYGLFFTHRAVSQNRRNTHHNGHTDGQRSCQSTGKFFISVHNVYTHPFYTLLSHFRSARCGTPKALF